MLIQAGAGTGTGISDDAYRSAGATIVETAEEVWGAAELLLKVKEPIAAEYPLLRSGQILFTYLHLAASRACTDALLAAGTTAIAYETVQLPNRTLPLLQPMSEVAGRLSIQIGAYHLMRAHGGAGLLLGGVPGTPKAKVVVIGGGVARRTRRGERDRSRRRRHGDRHLAAAAPQSSRGSSRDGCRRGHPLRMRSPSNSKMPTSSSVRC